MLALGSRTKNKGYSKLWWLILIFCCACNFYEPSAYAGDTPDKQQIVKQARQAYYSLSSHGFAGFEANMVPNWKLILKDEIATNPAGAEAGLKKLERLRFTISFDSTGKTKVTHETDLIPESAKEAEAFAQIYGGMEQAMTGFFDTWSLFMLYPPLPAVDSDYRLEEMANGYRISYMENTSSVITSMTKDFSIISISVIAPEFTSIINPVFTKTAQGYILTGYQGIYKGFEGANDITDLKVYIEYKKVNGFQLPGKLSLGGTHAGSPIGMEVQFLNYRLPAR